MFSWLRNISLYASISCGARDTADFFLAAITAHRKKSFVQIKDRLRYSALPLNPARKLCSRFARGRAVCNSLRLSKPFRLCQPSAIHFFSLDLLTLSELLALGKFTVSLSSFRRVALSRSYQNCLSLATRTERLHSRSRRVSSSTFQLYQILFLSATRRQQLSQPRCRRWSACNQIRKTLRKLIFADNPVYK
jgi:hypothetical protein